MKQSKKHRSCHAYPASRPVYPNAADADYFAGKALNALTAVLSGVGFITVMLFLVTLA